MGLLFWGETCLEVGFEGVQRGFSSEMRKVIRCRGTKDGKGRGTNSGESGTRNLETQSIRSRAESTGECVKLKTLTEIGGSSARDTDNSSVIHVALCF